MWLLNHTEKIATNRVVMWNFDFSLFSSTKGTNWNKKSRCEKFHRTTKWTASHKEWVDLSVAKKKKWNKFFIVLTGDDYSKYWKQLKRWQQRYRTLKWCSCIRTAIMTRCAAHAVQLYDPVVSVNHIKYRNTNFNFNCCTPCSVVNVFVVCLCIEHGGDTSNIFNSAATKTVLQPK